LLAGLTPIVTGATATSGSNIGLDTSAGLISADSGISSQIETLAASTGILIASGVLSILAFGISSQ
jgi:hypothetical protein